jgi:hypothetical protein
VNRESVVVVVVMTTGLLALMSYTDPPYQYREQQEGRRGRGREKHTNDRRYESNDSREMEKCSISPLGRPLPPPLAAKTPLPLSLDVRER